MAVTIFYSWQSDSASKSNYRFIKEALELAVFQIVADGHVEEAPRVDPDTKGVHGEFLRFRALSPIRQFSKGLQ